jgi:hypothetical protein
MSAITREPRRFVPLRESGGNEGGGKGNERRLRGVVFDVDGTLWLVICVFDLIGTFFHPLFFGCVLEFILIGIICVEFQ